MHQNVMPMKIQLVGSIRTISWICLYEVEFPWDEVTELVVKIIAESMYVQCDVNGCMHLLLESFLIIEKMIISQ